MARWPRRRTVLAGGLAAAGLGVTGTLVQREVLPGRVAIARLVAGGRPGAVPDAVPGPVLSGRFPSRYRRGLVTSWLVCYPPGTDPRRPVTPDGTRLPVCCFLHGRGNDERMATALGLDRFLAGAVRRGVPPFALAAVGGGDRYWHRRRDGDDPGRMVAEEFLPVLADTGLAARPTDRIGLMGISMGGYGALLLATVLGRSRVAAVVASSPALWLHAGDTAPGAFDDAADFRRNDVFDRRPLLRGIPVSVDCGLADPFHTAAVRFADGLEPRPEGWFGAGTHSTGYWRLRAPEHLAFLGRHLDRS